ncbi:hypothetical protein SCALM49S_01905 [Streptomyces californicus]
MLAELRNHAPSGVRTERAAFEELRPGERYGLVYAAASLHWTEPDGRWSRMAELLEPGGVFASFGGPLRPADPVVEEAVRTVRALFLASARSVPRRNAPGPGPAVAGDRTPAGTVVHRRTAVGGRAALRAERERQPGYLSTISAYIALEPARREELFGRIARVRPEVVEMDADITLHLARRRSEGGDASGRTA